MNKDSESRVRDDSGFNTIFDDVFRTMAQKMPFLMIPLINEVFGTEYGEDQTFEQLRNEFFESYGKIISDSILKIGENIYHVECQSRRDGGMAIRMLEYDMAIALEHTMSDEDGRISIRFPKSCVVYIRNHKDLGTAHELRLHFPDGRYIDYSVPVMQANSFSPEEIFEKDLLMLLPYYVLRYEHFLKKCTADNQKTDKIIDEFNDIMERLMDWSEKKDSPEILIDLTELMRTVTDHIIPEGQVRERLGEIMGGNILKLRSEELIEEGYAEGHSRGRNEGLKEGIKEGQIEERKIIALRMFNSGMDMDRIADIVDASEDEIRSWIGK